MRAPDYERGNVKLYCGDNREIMAALPECLRFDAIVTDPPYGIKEARGKNKRRGLLCNPKDFGYSEWDDEPCSPEQFAAMQARSRWQIVFGGNYIVVPPATCWLVWDKLNGETDFADCELAWTNLPKAVRRIQFRWNGMLRDSREPRVHPTQKPEPVMDWCLAQLPDGCQSVCDPFMGSGTTGVACVRRGLAFLGIEREPKYFALAVKRIDAAIDQYALLDPVPAAKQMELFAPEGKP